MAINIKCFVASPSDVAEERRAIEAVIDQCNKRLASSGSVVLTPIMWERNAVPSIGCDSQAIINEQLRPGECSIMFVIFGGRIGKPTPRAQSGTVEEFQQSYAEWIKNKQRKIHVYFKRTIDLPIDEIDGNQVEAVKRFKKELQAKGCLYFEYGTLEELKDNVDVALAKDVNELSLSGLTSEKGHPHTDGERVAKFLEARLRNALEVLGHHPGQWITRRLCLSGSLPCNIVATDAGVFNDVELLEREDNYVINAPSQFGLTSLSHFLVLEAWRRGHCWGYVDLKEVRLRKIEGLLEEIKSEFGCDELACIVVDSWVATHPQAQKLFEYLDSACPNARIILMQTNPEIISLPKQIHFRSKREFIPLQLLPLRKEDVRLIVTDFTKRLAYSQDEMLNKVLDEMEALNIHRTPMNCCTLLTVAEKSFHDSPINRAVMLDQVLFVLFNLHEIPSYSLKPDVKDCEFLLGALAEWLIREEKECFSEVEFFDHAKRYCESFMVDIDTRCLFDILVQNRILIKVRNTTYRFGALFWVYYFAAKRMEVAAEFKNYILSDRRYARFPDIVEFYTGLSRTHSDILSILCADLEQTKSAMDEKIGVKRNINPLAQLKWTGSEKDLTRMREQLSADVQNSNLPTEIKDRHADSTYKYLRPYDQSIDQYIESVSYHSFERQLQSLSRALRNSDFADVETRKRAMSLVMASWQEVAKILFIIAPALTTGGTAVFGGTRFLLDETWDDVRKRNDRQELFTKILMSIPMNVLSLVASDIASQKIAKLLYSVLDGSPSELVRHLIMRYLVAQRPNGWNQRVGAYVAQIGPRSFYQMDIKGALRAAMKYDYVPPYEFANLKQLYVESTSRFTNVPKDRIQKKVILDTKAGSAMESGGDASKENAS